MTTFLFDTIVLSEGQKAAPNASVSRWLASVLVTQTFISTVTIGEIHNGIARLPGGRRREELHRWLTQVVVPGFRDRILAFDTRAALAWGDISSSAARRGATLSTVDAQIAAIAKVHVLTLVTRNARRFADCGINVIDPWG